MKREVKTTEEKKNELPKELLTKISGGSDGTKVYRSDKSCPICRAMMYYYIENNGIKVYFCTNCSYVDY